MTKFPSKSMFAAALMSGQTILGSTMTPPQVFHAGEDSYPSVETRRIQMASSLAVADTGRIWTVWYAGPTPNEDSNNYVVLATSGDDGATWQESLVIDPDGSGPVRAFDPEIWLDPQGRMWVFWAQAVNGGAQAQTWAIVTENSGDAKPVWSAPRHIAPGVMMCKPTALSNGEWLLPISDWEMRMNKVEDGAGAGVWISEDKGATFSRRGGVLVPLKVRTYDEHMVVQRKDDSLWMLIRTKYGIGESVSRDLGKTWSDVEPSQISHPSARFFIRRLSSGNLLLVKHGAIKGASGRNRLTAFISKDDGTTWDGGLLLDARNGVSYPDGQEASDGTIYITYDYNRTQHRALHMATFTEGDALAGEDVYGKVRLRLSVSTPGLMPLDPIPPYEPGAFQLSDNATGTELATTGLTTLQPLDDRAVDTLRVGTQIWSNRTYVFSVLPDAVQGKRFIQADIGTRGVRGKAERDGWVYAIVRRSDEERFAGDGFEKTNIPEFIHFTTGNEFKEKDAVSVFQKNVKKGDVVSGNGALLVFAAE
jgi:predicted neuraminidase